MRGISWALLALAWLSLGDRAVAQDAPTYAVWGNYHGLIVELRVDEPARVAHVRLTNDSVNVIDIGWAPFADAAMAPFLNLKQLPFRGAYITPLLDAPTTTLKPDEVLHGDVRLTFPGAADGPYTHWCFAGSTKTLERINLFRLCEQAGR
jgi:hypothetical protein